MTPRERLLTVYRGGTPDCVASLADLSYWHAGNGGGKFTPGKTDGANYDKVNQLLDLHRKTGPDIHNIIIRNIHTVGQHHGVICLATSPSVYNITIENVIEETASSREACVKIYTGYGTGYRKGNLRKIAVTNVVSKGALYAAMVQADVEDLRLSNITQLNPHGFRLNLHSADPRQEASGILS